MRVGFGHDNTTVYKSGYAVTTTQKLDEKCGHGLAAWKIDGYHYHERADQTAAIDGTRMESRGLQVDACELPPGTNVVREKRKAAR